jgi:hypothetical protein
MIEKPIGEKSVAGIATLFLCGIKNIFLEKNDGLTAIADVCRPFRALPAN